MKLILLLMTSVLLCPKLWAADITLKDGKILSGPIEAEDEKEITLKVGGKMLLKIEKSRVVRIVRDEVPADKAGSATWKPSKTSPVTSSVTAPAAVVLPSVKNPEALTIHDVKTEGKVTYDQSRLTEVYKVKGANFAEVQSRLGLIDEDGNEKKADGISETKVNLNWSGKSHKTEGSFSWSQILLVSTITIRWPAWEAPAKISADDKKSWDTYVQELMTHDRGHQSIYERGVRDIADALLMLSVKSEEKLLQESERVVKSQLASLEKRQEGHDRLSEAPRKQYLTKPKKEIR